MSVTGSLTGPVPGSPVRSPVLADPIWKRRIGCSVLPASLLGSFGMRSSGTVREKRLEDDRGAPSLAASLEFDQHLRTRRPLELVPNNGDIEERWETTRLK